MDIQLKRGLLDVCVLAAIKNEDSYGYQIIKEIELRVKTEQETCSLVDICKKCKIAFTLLCPPGNTALSSAGLIIKPVRDHVLITFSPQERGE